MLGVQSDYVQGLGYVRTNSFLPWLLGPLLFKTDKSAILCCITAKVADFVSFKGLIVQGMKILKLFFKNLLTNFKKRV